MNNGNENKVVPFFKEDVAASKLQIDVSKPSCKVKIKVIGVGGCGCNIVDSTYNYGIKNVEFYVINTDAQALSNCKCPNKIQIGTDVTKGLGAGAVPDVGQNSALSAKSVIKEIIQDADMIFITAGLGGGTGTGASPIIAAIAREMGILTVAFVTRPFKFEGPQRSRWAEQGVEKLREFSDTMIIVSNEKLLEVVGKKASLTEAFSVANNVLAQGVQSISDLITVPGLINVDFADVRTIIGNTGKAVMGIGIGKGENRATEAIKKACAGSLLDKIVIKGATGALICFSGSNILLEEIYQAMSMIYNEVSESANIILGVVIDQNLKDEVKVTIIATGGKNDAIGMEPSKTEESAPQTIQPQQAPPPQPPKSIKSKLQLLLADDEPAQQPAKIASPVTPEIPLIKTNDKSSADNIIDKISTILDERLDLKEEKITFIKPVEKPVESVKVSPSVAEKLNSQVSLMSQPYGTEKIEEPNPQAKIFPVVNEPKNIDLDLTKMQSILSKSKPEPKPEPQQKLNTVTVPDFFKKDIVKKEENPPEKISMAINPAPMIQEKGDDEINEMPDFLRKRRRYFD